MKKEETMDLQSAIFNNPGLSILLAGVSVFIAWSFSWSFKRTVALTRAQRLLRSVSREFNDVMMAIGAAVQTNELDPYDAQDKVDFLRDLYVYMLQDIEQQMIAGKTSERSVRLKS